MPLEVISAYGTNQAANTRLTMFGEDSNVIRNFPNGKKASLLCMWGTSGGDDVYNAVVRSPRMHDNVNGIMWNPGDDLFYVPGGVQDLVAQDNLNLFTGDLIGDGGYFGFHHLIYYEDLPSSMGNYATWDEIKDKLGQVMTMNHTLTPASQIDYSAGEVITTNQDEFDALKNYAFLGFGKWDPSDQNTSFFLRGHNTGNLRIGLPFGLGNVFGPELPFITLAKATGLPVIPIINAANKDNHFIDCYAGENVGDSYCLSYWARLEG
jgi:hypothetical protein